MHSKPSWTAPMIRRFKKNDQTSLTMITAYDATMARWCEQSKCDLILVGDSLGMVVQGAANTINVSVDDMAYHTRCVRLGAPKSFIVTDLPFGSYQASDHEGVSNAVRLIKAGANAVKLEGPYDTLIKKLVEAGIPVMGHLGLTPQSIHKFGGFGVQGTTEKAAKQLVMDARKLEEAGCIAMVLEAVPEAVAELITEQRRLPTIGIGAGQGTDGQVLVLHDLLGFDQTFKPKFVKNYAQLEDPIVEALDSYCDEVNQKVFPTEQHTYQ